MTTATSDKSSVVGALIAEVTAGGGADKAGLKKGDVVTVVQRRADHRQHRPHRAGAHARSRAARAKLVYVRGNDSSTITVTWGRCGTLRAVRAAGPVSAGDIRPLIGSSDHG